jgi:hypothetical protein
MLLGKMMWDNLVNILLKKNFIGILYVHMKILILKLIYISIKLFLLIYILLKELARILKNSLLLKSS